MLIKCVPSCRQAEGGQWKLKEDLQAGPEENLPGEAHRSGLGGRPKARGCSPGPAGATGNH